MNLYAEDMLEIQRERNRLLNEIEQMESQFNADQPAELESIE